MSPASTDKSLNKELLSAPIRLAISTDVPKQYPAWNMDFDQEQAAPPRPFVSGAGADPHQRKWSGSGIARNKLAKPENSTLRFKPFACQAGDAGNRVEFGNAIDWRTLACQPLK